MLRMSEVDEQQRENEQREFLKERWNARLVPQWVDAAIGWLETKWGSVACPYCGTNGWEVGHQIVEQRSWGLGAVFPVFLVTCENCGHTVHVDADKAGVVSRLPVEEGEATSEELSDLRRTDD